MASDMLTTAILGIAALIIVSTLVATLMPQIFQMAGLVTSVSGNAGDRIRTSATVVNYDVPTPGRLQFDVLNNGEASLAPSRINMTVAYLYNESMPAHMLAQGVSSSTQYWEYTVTGNNDSQWEPGEVLEVSVVSPGYDFTPGEYTLKLLLNNGAGVQYRFTI